jgi:hypothetical protein
MFVTSYCSLGEAWLHHAVEEGWYLGGDPAEVHLKGTSTVVDHFGGNPPLVGPDFFEVTLQEGGPGEGWFFYVDSVTSGDEETVLTGRINIRN